MKNKLIYIVLILIILGWVFFIFKNQKYETSNILLNTQENQTKRIYDKNNTKIFTQDFEVNGISMTPMIKPWQKVEVKMNYYNSWKNEPKSWDIIIFENPFTLEKIIKKVSLVPNDLLKYNSKDKTLEVNWKILKNSAWTKYIFSENEFKLINIYIKDWKIIPWVYFIFWDNTISSMDSRSFWPITIEWILWKVEL